MRHEDLPVALASYEAHPTTPGDTVYCAGFEAWLTHELQLSEVSERLRAARVAAREPELDRPS
jgi:hypothetical protein